MGLACNMDLRRQVEKRDVTDELREAYYARAVAAYRSGDLDGIKEDGVILVTVPDLQRWISTTNIYIDAGQWESEYGLDATASELPIASEDDKNIGPQTDKPDDSKPLRCNRWSQLQVELKDEEKVLFSCPSASKVFHYSELGLMNEKSKKRKVAWTLFKRLEEEERVLSTRNLTRKGKDLLRHHVNELISAIQSKVEGPSEPPPIEFIRTHDCELGPIGPAWKANFCFHHRVDRRL